MDINGKDLKKMKLVKKNYINFSGKVYDLTVSTPEHSYVVNNVVVHNSAGGSLLAYILGIIKIDPIPYKLLFERFLNVGRLGTRVEESFIILNDSLEFKKGSQIKILRGGEELEILVENIREGDIVKSDSI